MFFLISSEGEDGSVLLVAKVLLSSRLNSLTDSGGTAYNVVECKECTAALD